MFIFQTLIKNRSLIWQLAKHKLHEQYAATWIGSLWAVLEPMLTLLVFWFVFTYGFKSSVTDDSQIPYFLTLFCGLIPWMAVSNALQGGTHSIISHPYLVKKIVFPLEILPIVQIVAAFIVHLYMLGFLLLMFIIYDHWPSFIYIQVFYYAFAWIVLALGLSFLLSALNVFHRDVGHTLNLLLMLWFWLTPIVWPVKNIPMKLLPFVQLNPVYYIVEGYRNTFLLSKPFWQDWQLGIYFWSVCLLLFIFGFIFFNRVKFQFSDVI